MLKLIVGVKGTGKTKILINMVNEAIHSSRGNVVCIEKGIKLRYDIKYQARLINTEDYMITDAQALYGFVAGIFASNHDVTDLFIDSSLKICNNDIKSIEFLSDELEKIAEPTKANIVMTISYPVEEIPESIKKYI